MVTHSLVGSWRLVSILIKNTTGRVLHPYGENPAGLLIYSADGTMSAVLMRRGRPRFASGDVYNPTPQELQAAFQGFDAYCGRYSIDANAQIVIHHVEASRFPNWEGVDLVRHYRLEGNRLSITSEPTHGYGDEWVIYADWERRV